jgi:hypothetical protein
MFAHLSFQFNLLMLVVELSICVELVFLWLGFDVVCVCILVRNNIVVVENVNEVDDKFTCDASVNLSSNTLDVGNIHL